MAVAVAVAVAAAAVCLSRAAAEGVLSAAWPDLLLRFSLVSTPALSCVDLAPSFRAESKLVPEEINMYQYQVLLLHVFVPERSTEG